MTYAAPELPLIDDVDGRIDTVRVTANATREIVTLSTDTEPNRVVLTAEEARTTAQYLIDAARWLDDKAQGRT